MSDKNTVLHNGRYEGSPFKHYAGVHSIYGSDRYQQFYGITPNPVTPEDIDFSHPNIIPFLSEKKKVFISLMNGPFHFFHDTLGPTIYMINQFPDAQYIFDASKMYHFDDAYLKHFYTTLYKKKIDFKVLNFKMGDIIVANNFYIQDTGNDIFDAGNNLYNFFQNDVKNKNVKPFRKIYLSRKKMLTRNYEGVIKPGPSHMHDDRIINEPLLEKYLSNLGFEIVVPEEFSSFSEQINHYHETKTVVSVTSSGLTPACAFMQPRSNVVELINTMVVPLERPDPEKLIPAEESLHLFYISLSFNRDHNFFAIPNKTRKAEDIIKKIEESPSMRSVFMED